MSFLNNLTCLKVVTYNLKIIRNLNAHTAGITRTHRLKFPRSYPTVLVQPDGSSFNIRYDEPRKIIKV